MKQILFILSAIVTLQSCHYTSGSGKIVLQNRATGSFNGISASNGFEVEVKIGPNTDVVIEADDNIMQYVETVVDDGVLEIGIRQHHSVSNAHLKAYITVPGLTRVAASSGSDILIKDLVKNDGKLTFRVSSAGEIVADVDAPEVDADASSSGNIQLRGRTKSYDAEISSGGEIKSADLLSETTRVSVSSGGTAYVHASVKLVANASSGGNIYYHGTSNLEQSVSSGGSVERQD